MNTSKTLLYFGNERLVSGLDHTDAPILRGLIENGYNVKAVISHHSDTRSRKPRPLEVAEIATEHGIPVLLPNKPTDIIDQLRNFNADAAILVAYGRIIPQSIIDLFPLGIINIHPSLLPKYRGPTPIETPIQLGDTQTGVSIMQLSAGMDEGPVYTQAELPLTGNEDKFQVYEQLKNLSAELLFSSLPQVLDGSLQPQPQNNSEATYTQLLQKSDAFFDPNKLSAVDIERRVRAHLGFPKTKFYIEDNLVTILKAHVSKAAEGGMSFECADKNFLVIDELVAPSGKTMSSTAFANGLQSQKN